jgi:4-amino-4-deoxy-L-arabinose transferase-like glycosyltransferase
MASLPGETLEAPPLPAGQMLYVSLLVELLRSRPALLFWGATLAQALLWTLVPALVYSAPPGDVALTLATGHEWVAGSRLGPPLANWLAEIAFGLAGHHMIGVYLLSQICVVISFWAVFALGRSIVGAHHALMAVLLMTGIIAFSVPTPEFGPSVLAMPLTALAWLQFWRALGEGKRRYWFVLGIDLGLLLLTTYAGLIAAGLILLFTVATARGRASATTLEPWLGGMIAVLVVFPHLIWIDRSGSGSFAAGLALSPGRIGAWIGSIGWLIAFHAGALVLIAVTGGFNAAPRAPAPVFERAPVAAFAKQFVYFFALAPVLAGTLPSRLLGQSTPLGGSGPLLLLTALAAVVAAGDAVRLHNQRILGRAWMALLLVPPAAVIVASLLLPWTLAVGFQVDRPAAAMGQFFTDTFHRRTGAPLHLVVGDAPLAGLVAFASADRPSLMLPDQPELTPWAGAADVREKGAIVLWPIADLTGAPPAAIRKSFPDLIAEVPRSFERKGRLPLYRVGWGVIRPGGSVAPAR